MSHIRAPKFRKNPQVVSGEALAVVTGEMRSLATDDPHTVTGRSTMKFHLMVLSAAALLLLPLSNAHGGPSGSLGFNAKSIGGPDGEVFLTGGGVYDPATGFVKAGGAFRCLADINQGPLSGLKTGEGVRWEAVELLASSPFKCGAPMKPEKPRSRMATPS
jgi:hypothetical protein